jgi:hypothetical protein
MGIARNAAMWVSVGPTAAVLGVRGAIGNVDRWVAHPVLILRQCGSTDRAERMYRRAGIMLLFQKAFHAGLVDGSITLTFRRWDKPHVKPGGRYRCHPIGVLEVDAIRRMRVRDISEADARRAGFATRVELVSYIGEGHDEVWRVELHHGGDGDRVPIALDDRLSRDDVAAIATKLDRMGDWTRPTLKLIAKHPRVAASQLASKLGRETEPFKLDVRKLKKLGLTQSFEVGYELSPRGRAFLSAAGRVKHPARRS